MEYSINLTGGSGPICRRLRVLSPLVPTLDPFFFSSFSCLKDLLGFRFTESLPSLTGKANECGKLHHDWKEMPREDLNHIMAFAFIFNFFLSPSFLPQFGTEHVIVHYISLALHKKLSFFLSSHRACHFPLHIVLDYVIRNEELTWHLKVHIKRT